MRAINAILLKLFWAGLLLFAAVRLAGADATVPTADIEGAADNHLAKRYEGSFIVSYEKFAYTDFTVPLSPLKPSADADARDAMNNRIYAPDKKAEVEGALTRIAYVLPAERSPLEVLRNYQDVIEAAGGEVLFDCKKDECGGAADRSSSGGGGDMSLMMYFFHESDIKDAAFSNGACAVTTGINDQRFFAAKVPQDGGDAYVTVQAYSLIDDLYCKELNGRTIAVVQVLEPKARDKKMVVVEAAKMADSLVRHRLDLALRHLLRHRQGRHQAGIGADAEGDLDAVDQRARHGGDRGRPHRQPGRLRLQYRSVVAAGAVGEGGIGLQIRH